MIDIAENHLYDDELLASIEDAMVKITDMDETVVAPLVGKALFNLHVSCPPVEVVEKLLDMFPMALNVRNSDGLFPIQFAVNDVRNSKWYSNYMHLFVNKSCKGQLHQVLWGEKNSARGTALQMLVGASALQMDHIVEVVDHFCKQGFITKEDVENYDLLAHSCRIKCKERFECLARWHKEALKTSRVEDKPLLYHHLSEGNFDSIEVFLRASFQLFPDESGLLFIGDYSDQDHVLLNQDVLENSLETLEKVIRPISVPLLHQICKRSDVGGHLYFFEHHLPFLCDLLDEDGRTYSQALFAYCPEQLIVRPEAIHTIDLIVVRRPRLDDISLAELETRDPVIGLLPFMTVARNGSVGCIYEVLLKHPTALLNCMESSGGQKVGPMTLKRKRDDSN